MSFFEVTNIAETAPAHQDEKLRTRRYRTDLSLSEARRAVETIIPTIKTYGLSWKLTQERDGDSSENVEVVRAEVPVVIFTDDLRATLTREGDEIVINIYSKSRVGKGDLGENRRHILQLLEKLDGRFAGNANS